MTGLGRKLFRDYKSLRGQVVTIAILVICGVSVLVSSWSSYQSLWQSKESYYKEFHFADIFADIVRAAPAVLKKIENLAGVQRVEARIVKEGLVEVPTQSEPALGRFISIAPGHQLLNCVYLRLGRMPHMTSLASDRLEAVVHEAFAVAHHLKLGDTLEILLEGQKRKIQISGIGLSPEYVYALSPIAPLPDDKHFGIFWLQEDVVRSLVGMKDAFNSLQIKISAEASVPELKRQIDQILQPYGGIQAYDRSQQISNIFVEDEIRQQRVMAIVMPCIFLTVAMFILNIMLSRLISLHRGQIATLKSLGYSSYKLTFHYFLLVTLVLLTGIGPALLTGYGIGKWYAGLYNDFFRFPKIDFSLSFESLALGILAGLIPGWIGATTALLKVFYLQPAEALRPPSPPIFHQGWFERTGLAKRFHVLSKMVIRSLMFRPLRTTLSVLGVSAALAILINGSFWTDVIDFMMDRQFHEMRREDLSIKLLHPQKQSVFSELRMFPGIVLVEGRRAVPVRLEYLNLKKETLLTGLEEGAQLFRVMDDAGHIVQPVKGGLVLSRYFESEFKLKVGDQVRIQVLEGDQIAFSAQVMGFVDDLIGQQVYVLKKDLHSWLKEEPSVDSLDLKIDPHYVNEIYVKLKQRPQVVAISIRKLLLQGFSETIANMIVTFTFILYLFAIAIAGAVMYNSARISFSERAWELASLRIMGYSKMAVFELLFFDIGWQLVMALVPGLILGYGLCYLSTDFIHNETYKFPLVIDLKTYGAAILVLLLTFLVSGGFLYRKVSKLDFSEALRARE